VSSSTPPRCTHQGRSEAPRLSARSFDPIVRGRLTALFPGGFGIAYSDGVGAAQLLASQRGRAPLRAGLDGFWSSRSASDSRVLAAPPSSEARHAQGSDVRKWSSRSARG
jgi:hypothetical protein